MTNTEVATAQLVHADPATLLTDRNNRRELRLDAQFLASIAESGVLVPIVAVRTADDTLRVRMGHRRIAAAVTAKLATVPVYVVGNEATGDDAEIDRLISQWSENEHRTGYIEAERLDNIEQLSLLGVSADQIAKRMKIERPTVDAALTIANNTAARDRLENTSLTLDQAAAFAEFEDDPDALDRLENGLRFGRLDHEIQRQRDAKELSAKRAAAAQPLIELGFRNLDRRPNYGDTTAVRLDYLIDEAGDAANDETIDPAHLAVFMEHSDGYAIIETGEPVDEDDIDFEADEDGEPEEGLHHPRAIANTDLWESVYYCTDLAAAGLHRCDGRGNTTAATGETSEQKEKRLAAHRQVIDNNKAWTSAETVRLQWLTTYLARKTAPKGSAAFVADALAHRRGIIGGFKVGRTINALLGTEDIVEGYRSTPGIAALIAKATEGRAQVLVLAEILAAHEAVTGKHVWRNRDENTVAYLRYLESIGYTLSEIETTACTIGPAGH